jgi:hypothetical protein
MNKEISEALNKEFDNINKEINEFIKKKEHEREHASSVEEICQKAYDKFIEAFKLAIGDNVEHKDDEIWEDKFVIKDSMTGNPIYDYNITTSIDFRSDEWEYDDDNDDYYAASTMTIYVYFKSPLSDDMGKTVFEYKLHGDEMEFQQPSDLRQNIAFGSSLLARSLGIDDWDSRVFDKIRRTNEFSWEHLAQYQCQMLKLELVLLDYGKHMGVRTNYDGILIPNAFVEVFNCLTDKYYWYNGECGDFENMPENGRLKTRIRIRECAELIKSALPFMEYFHAPRFKKRFMYIVMAACKLGLHEDQLIITEFIHDIPDPSDKWEL